MNRACQQPTTLPVVVGQYEQTARRVDRPIARTVPTLVTLVPVSVGTSESSVVRSCCLA